MKYNKQDFTLKISVKWEVYFPFQMPPFSHRSAGFSLITLNFYSICTKCLITYSDHVKNAET